VWYSAWEIIEGADILGRTMRVTRYCTVLFLLAALAGPLHGQSPLAPPPAPAPGEAIFIVFAGGRDSGREQVRLSRTASGWTITSSGRLGPPLNINTKRFEVTYAPDWQPIELKIEAAVQSRALGLSTSFGTTTAINEISLNGVINSKTDQISARTVVLPNNFFAAYEGLAVRLASAEVGADVPVYIAPQGEIRMLVKTVTPSSYQTPSGSIQVRQYAVSFQNPGGPLDAVISIDDRNRFAKLDIPAAGLLVVRQDLAGVATREQTLRNPTDTDHQIPASGFTLAGTVTTPPAQGRLRHPAIVLVAGSGPIERDGVVAGIPLFAQLAGQLAEQGFVVLRYDKRGVGQSGGRTETVTLKDYAEDAIAAVKWLAKRKDVDDKRVFVLGHDEGAPIAMLAAREKKIAGLVLMAGLGTTGRDLVLEQQQHALDSAKTADPERSAKIDLQKKILEAAVTGKGWESLPPEVRPIVDTPSYRSLLMFDAAQAMTQVKQPLLILQGALDMQVRPAHADRLAELGRTRKKAASVELKHLPGVNHLFVPAKTGEVTEYPVLETKAISPEVARSIVAWVASVPR
jgi:uncharacterized protein